MLLKSWPSSIFHLFKESFKTCADSFRCCLAFLFFSVKIGLQLVVNSLYFHLWRHILIVALIVATSSKVFLIWLNVMSYFPLNHGNNSATLHFICLLRSFRSFGAVDSTSTLIISNIVPICWFGQSWLFCFLSDLFCYLASAFACLAVDAPSATRSATTPPCSSSHVKMFYGLGSAMAKMACSLCSVTITYLRISMVCLSRKNQALNSKALHTWLCTSFCFCQETSSSFCIGLRTFQTIGSWHPSCSTWYHLL